jgi:hypothetical protein
MAGDHVNLGVEYWYPAYEESKNKSGVSPEDLLGSLTGFLSGDASALSGGKATPTELSQPDMLPWHLSSFLTNQSNNENVIPGRPNAYLNWILLDEQFKYVPEGSGYIRVRSYDATMQALANTGLPIVKSGYLYVYLS